MTREHATASILSIGDELTLGQNLDTNSRWISDRLLALGILTVEHVTVPDDAARTAQALRRLGASSDLVISTGGLGPTSDDLTREALAQASGSPLVEDTEALARIEAWFTRARRPMPPLNRTQARRPQGATCMENTAGTAPGLHATIDGVDVFCLPGPPREMTAMFERSVLPRLRPPAGQVHTRALHSFGLGESEVATRLGDLMDRTRTPLVGTTVSEGIVTCRVRYQTNRAREQAANHGLATDPLAETERHIRERLHPYVFGSGADTLPGVVLDLLKNRSQTLAVVESCTGGVLGALITEVPGSSAAFRGGWITYANEMKQQQIGVPAALFRQTGSGAVSRECAEAMATGGLERSGADHCLAVTGIAGPDGGTPDKPVGTVWIARADRTAVEARKFLFLRDRRAVRDWSAKSALAMLRLALIGAGPTPLLRQVDA